jgi:hypothetical protein
MPHVQLPEEDDGMIGLLLLASPVLGHAKARSVWAMYRNDTTLSTREREGLRKGRLVGRTPDIAKMLDAGAELVQSRQLVRHFSPSPIPDDFYLHVEDYATWSGYSVRERLAIEFGSRYTNSPATLGHDHDFWGRLRAAFTDREIVDSCFLLATWTSMHIMCIVLGLLHEPSTAEIIDDGQPWPYLTKLVELFGLGDQAGGESTGSCADC